MAHQEYEDDYSVRDDPRTIDCEEWARRKAAEMRLWQPLIPVSFMRITPKRGDASFIGNIILPGRVFSPKPAWTHHWAVISCGVARDEMYPYGVAQDRYQRLFINHKVLDFVELNEIVK